MINNTDRLFSTYQYRDVMYLVIPKCGCTFVKNFLWRLDYDGVQHPNPQRVHDSDADFARASQFDHTRETVRSSEYAFTVLRNPIERFLSLYFDKVIGDGYKRFVPLRSTLQENADFNPNALDVESHRRNCVILIDWIEQNLKGNTSLAKDPHWTPISWRNDLMKEFNLKLLMIFNLESKMEVLLRQRIPNVRQYLSGTERYSAKRQVDRSVLVDADLNRRISQVYEGDSWLTHRVWQLWDTRKPVRTEDIPRAADVFR